MNQLSVHSACINRRSPEVVGFSKMAAEMDIAHARRVAAPAGVKSVLVFVNRCTWPSRCVDYQTFGPLSVRTSVNVFPEGFSRIRVRTRGL